jgi:hypothetical protein
MGLAARLDEPARAVSLDLSLHHVYINLRPASIHSRHEFEAKVTRYSYA